MRILPTAKSKLFPGTQRSKIIWLMEFVTGLKFLRHGTIRHFTLLHCRFAAVGEVIACGGFFKATPDFRRVLLFDDWLKAFALSPSLFYIETMGRISAHSSSPTCSTRPNRSNSTPWSIPAQLIWCCLRLGESGLGSLNLLPECKLKLRLSNSWKRMSAGLSCFVSRVFGP